MPPVIDKSLADILGEIYEDVAEGRTKIALGKLNTLHAIVTSWGGSIYIRWDERR